MKLAIMQPYFFPYIGYWQLIRASDTFILFDDVQYIRHGWINRNRIIDPRGGWQYITAPLEKHDHAELIKNVYSHPNQDWKNKLLGQLNHYRRRAPYFSETLAMVTSILSKIDDRRICFANRTILGTLSCTLGMKREFLVSSEQHFDYASVEDAGDWALCISQQLGASEYINPISGAALFNPEKFSACGITLSFLQPHDITYPQRGTFEPWLSILDVLMFNGIEGTRALLDQYSLISGTDAE